MLKARGICPGCTLPNEGPKLFCFACRQQQTEKARDWYDRMVVERFRKRRSVSDVEAL
jgi:pentatricopeptide repeat protein